MSITRERCGQRKGPRSWTMKALRTEEAAMRYMEDILWKEYKRVEAVQVILKLDIEVHKTKKKVAEGAMRNRFEAFLCEFGSGRRALRTQCQ